MGRRIISFVKPGDLVVRDLGYFAMENFHELIAMNAYFLSRLKPGVCFYLNADDDEPFDLEKYLKATKRLKNVLELKGYLSKEKIPIRLIIYRQTQEITEQRIRAARKQARKKGETISKSKKLLLSFAMFITNAPEDMLSTATVGTIYRLRWEVELIFKRWKSQLEIDYLQGIHRERIDCLIWSRLCTVIILELVIGLFKNIVDKFFDRELSEVKLIQYMMRNDRFCLAMMKNDLEYFFEEMERDIPRMLLKDKRSRRTMRDRVFHHETYYGIQIMENQSIA